jgi:hypothetical protein
MNPLELYEAYSAVYDEDLREELLTEETILLESIDELYDDELEEIVEESIYSMLDEGYDIDEVEEIFEEVFSEARLDMAARIAQRKKEAAESEKSAKTARSRGASVVRKEKRAEAISRVKGAVKSGVERVKQGARELVDKPARKYAEKRGVVPSKSGKTSLKGGTGIDSVAYKQKTSAGRREVRSRVLGDIASRARAKVGRGVEKVRSAGEKAAGAVKSSSDAAQARAREAGASAKAGAKSLAGKAARAVSRGARNVARKLGEDVDAFDIVLEHLLDEGYADTEEAATVIMANMSEEWREEILDEANKTERRFGYTGLERQASRNSSSQPEHLRMRMKLSQPLEPRGSVALKAHNDTAIQRQERHQARRGKKTKGL